MKNLGAGMDAGLGASVSTFTNLNGLQKIKQVGEKDQDAAMKEMAKQFESIFLDLMLKTMREANAVFREGGMFDSSEMDFHQEMFDHQLALTLSSGRGIGLADVFYRQLQQKTKDTVERIEQALPLDAPKRPVRAEPTASNEVTPFSESQEAFVQALAPHAERAGRKLGVSPSVLLAQAALETGWGKYVAKDACGASSFNLFNIKADQRWQGPSVRVATLEYRDGVAEREVANFRQYNSVGESFDDYVRFVGSQPRYQEALAADDSENFVRQLHQAGYATDPQYAEKILRLMESSVIQSAASTQVATDTPPQG